MPSQLAQYALYSAAAISVASVVGHTQMGFEVVFPSLRKAGEKDKGATSAKIGWLEGNQVFAIMCNWANFFHARSSLLTNQLFCIPNGPNSELLINMRGRY